ncbi:hypothetical protein CVT25_005924 [Psilocybe cyanescens]|uniref:Uncharacterized protein n=1 Tax=Psilocybe cyanescens TaxID=93625 RepID=A0A409VSV9_PSICY|nr:hypothetical protein CVT25_005924 [Psilocybe cyanescens]
MKSAFAAVTAALCFAASALAQDNGPPLVNTPINPPVCQPLLITWGGGTQVCIFRSSTPLRLSDIISSILPGGQPGAAALLDFGQQTGTSLTWTVNITAGTSLGLVLRDSTGTVSQSAPFTVQSSSDTSCLNGGSSSSSSSSGSSTSSGLSTSSGRSSSSSSSSTSITSPATTPTAPTSSHTSLSTSSSHSSTSSPSPSNTPSSAAPIQNVKMGLVGALGAALIAVLA